MVPMFTYGKPKNEVSLVYDPKTVLGQAAAAAVHHPLRGERQEVLLAAGLARDERPEAQVRPGGVEKTPPTPGSLLDNTEQCLVHGGFPSFWWFHMVKCIF